MIARVTLWICGLAIVGVAGGLLFFKFATPVYEARGLALLDPPSPDLQKAAVSILRSPGVFQAAVQAAPSNKGEPSLGDSARVLPSADNMVEVKVDSPSKESGIAFVNAWLAAYKTAAQVTNEGFNKARLADKGLAVRQARARLTGIEKEIAAFEKKTNIPDIGAAVTAAQTYEANLLAQQDQDKSSLETTKLQADQEKRQLGTMPKVTQSGQTESATPELKAKQEHLAALEAERAQLLSLWLPTSAKVVAKEREIQVVESDIAKTSQRMFVDRRETAPNAERIALETSYFNHLAQIAGYKGSLNEVAKALEKQKTSTQGLPAAQIEMARLKRDQDLAETSYKSLRSEYDAIVGGTVAPALPSLNQMNSAQVSPNPVFPILSQSVAYGAGIGAFLGLILGLVTKSRPQVEEPIRVGPELPLLVTAPPLPARRGEGLGVLALEASNPAEAYRFMVFSLQARENPAKTILFTAVSNDPLCAEAAAQFAVAMSQTGVRTLLIDCNLRDPSLTKAFGFLGKSGITDILSRTMLPSAGNDLVLETGHPELYFLPAGTLESEGIGGFLNLQVQGMLHDVMERAEIKVVNTPACAIVSDASRLARHADQICLVANRHDQAKGLVAKAENILRLAGAREIEVVLIDEKRARDSFIA